MRVTTATLVVAAAAAGAVHPASGSQTTLGTSLAGYFQTQDGDINTLFSAMSIETCFSLIYPGAGGNTATELAATLGFDPTLSGEDVFDAYQASEAALEAAYDGAVLKQGDWEAGQRPLFLGANKIYVDDDFALKQEYLDIVARLVEVIDLAGANAADYINEWCGNATNGLIDDVVQDVSEAVVVAVNAVYLNATWSSKFQAQHTLQAVSYTHLTLPTIYSV